MKKKEPRKPKYVTTLENEVVRLAKKVKELEETTLRVGQQVRFAKEPETFEDCVEKVNENQAIFNLTTCGTEIKVPGGRLDQLEAIAKMMTVADALNGGHVTDGIGLDAWEKGVGITGSYQMVSFKTEALARKAIKILGEETIKTAFGL